MPYLENYYIHQAKRTMTFDTLEDWINFWVPYEWRDLICMCAQPKNSKATEGPRHCGICGKFERWQLSTCSQCGVRHFTRFKHYMRNHKGWCWDCLVAAYGVEDGDAPTDIKPKELRSLSEIMTDDPFAEDLNFTV